MELAVSVIGQMASQYWLWNPLGLWVGPGREGRGPKLPNSLRLEPL